MARLTYPQSSINGSTVSELIVKNDIAVDNDAIIGHDLSVANDATIGGNTTLGGDVTITGSITLGTNEFIVKRYVSDPITQDSFNAGQTQSIALAPAISSNILPLGCYPITSVETTSSSGDTTGLTVELGIGGGDEYFSSVSIFGSAGRKSTVPGTFIGGFRTGDTLQATFTAVGGGSEDLTDIDQMSVRFVVYFVESASE